MITKNIFFIILLSSFFTICNTFNIYSSASQNNNSPPKKPNTLDTIRLSFVGDIMVHQEQLWAQYDLSTKKYSFINNFKYVKPYIEKSDLSFCNVETTFAGTNFPYSAHPTFNTPDDLIDALKYSGFDIISTINNHSNDRGKIGIERTYSILNEHNLDVVGVKETIQSKNYIIKDINNIKIGITSFSYCEIKDKGIYLNTILVSESIKNRLNVFDPLNLNNTINLFQTTIDNMKKDGAEVIIFMVHWGDEYNRTPNEYQQILAQSLCNMGTHIVIGSHPHVIQPVTTLYNRDKSHSTLVAYSLGNFISNQRKEILNKDYTEDGVILNIDITKDIVNNIVTIKDIKYIPTWVNKYVDKNVKKTVYEIIPILSTSNLSQLKNINQNKAFTSFSNTVSILKNLHLENEQ